MSAEVRSKVAELRKRVSELRDAKARIEERVKADEARLQEIVSDLEGRGLPTNLKDLEAFVKEQKAEAESGVEQWEERLNALSQDIQEVKKKVTSV